MQHAAGPSCALIADDDANVRALLSVAVARVGLESVQAEDGRKTIELLADLSPTLVLLGAKLPGLSGIEVCWWIRRQRHLTAVPVILVGAGTCQFQIDAGLLAGANHHITKPFTSAQAAAVIARQLRRRPLLPPPVRVIIPDSD